MQSAARLSRVPPELVGAIWPYARGLLESASKKTGRGDFNRLESEVLSGLQVLWLAHDGRVIEAAVATQLIKENGRKVCVLVACGGKDRSRWISLIEGIEAFAREEGCTEMRIYGRKGWQRVLNGYRQRAVILGKELT